MTRPCGNVGQKREEITKDIRLYLWRSSEIYIIQNNWYTIPQLIKIIIILNELFYFLGFIKMKSSKKHTDNVFGGCDTLFLIGITILKVNIIIIGKWTNTLSYLFILEDKSN